MLRRMVRGRGILRVVEAVTGKGATDHLIHTQCSMNVCCCPPN